MHKELLRLAQDLISIDSQNPPGDEREIITFIKSYLKKLSVNPTIYTFEKDRPNLICALKSRSSKKRLILTPHVDTVPAGSNWRFEPFSGRIYKGKLYGRGATDCKGNVAVALSLIKKLKETNTVLQNLDLVFAFCADEETGSHYGIIPLLKLLKSIDYGLVLDGDDFDIVVAQKGLLHVRLELFGKEAHGAFPERGINAIEYGVRIVYELLHKKWAYKIHSLLKKPTLNIGRFAGGDKVNIVAGHCFIELDIRYIPSMDKKVILSDIVRIIKKYPVKYKVKILAHQKPIEIDKNNFLIRILQQTLKEKGIHSKLKPSFGATVINFLKDEGIEGFAFGFGTKGQAHAKNEYVKIANLTKGVEVLAGYVQALDAFFN